MRPRERPFVFEQKSSCGFFPGTMRSKPQGLENTAGVIIRYKGALCFGETVKNGQLLKDLKNENQGCWQIEWVYIAQVWGCNSKVSQRTGMTGGGIQEPLGP